MHLVRGRLDDANGDVGGQDRRRDVGKERPTDRQVRNFVDQRCADRVGQILVDRRILERGSQGGREGRWVEEAILCERHHRCRKDEDERDGGEHIQKRSTHHSDPLTDAPSQHTIFGTGQRALRCAPFCVDSAASGTTLLVDPYSASPAA